MEKQEFLDNSIENIGNQEQHAESSVEYVSENESHDSEKIEEDIQRKSGIIQGTLDRLSKLRQQLGLDESSEVPHSVQKEQDAIEGLQSKQEQGGDVNLKKMISKLGRNTVMGVVFSGMFACNGPDQAVTLDHQKDEVKDSFKTEQVADDNLWERFKKVPEDQTDWANFTRRGELYSKQELMEETEKQKEWIIDYINSPKYTERLTSELVRDGMSLEEAQSAVQDMVQKRARNILEGKYSFKSSLTEDGETGIVLGIYGSKDTTSTLDVHTSQPIVANGTRSPLTPPPGDVYISEEIYTAPEGDGSETVPVHEFSHQSTDGDAEMINNTKLEIDSLAKSDFVAKFKDRDSGVSFDYYDAPTEVKARIDVLRYLADKYDIYDAGTEDFTEEHLDQLLRVNEIRDNSNVRDLFRRQLENKDDLIFLMNEMASLDDVQGGSETVA